MSDPSTYPTNCFFKAPLPTQWLLLGSPMLSQQHAVSQLQQEVTRPKARLKPTSTKKSEVDGGATVPQ